MNVWLSLPAMATSAMAAVAGAAEAAGVDGIAISDHVCVTEELESTYPYTGKRAVLPVDASFPDPLVLAANLSARTTTIRFMTHVLIAPLRHPVLLAKQVATTATVSGDRFDLGVGVGWMREEFDALGVDFHTRGARLDEMLPLLRQLWSGQVAGHHGAAFSFGPLTVHPVPKAGVPILVGGHSDAALRRAALLGDGWVGVNPSIDELRELLAKLHDERRRAGTDGRAFVVRTGLRGRLDPAALRALAALGVDGVVVLPWQVLPDPADPAGADAVIAVLPDLVARVRAATEVHPPDNTRPMHA